MHATQSSAPANPWWREPWPWLLMAGPLVVIIGCGITIWLAVTHPDPAIQDNVAQRGLVVEKTVSVPAHTINAAHGEAR